MKEVEIQTLSDCDDRKKYLESLIEGDTFHARFLFQSSFKNAKILRDTIDSICSSMGLDSKWKTRREKGC